MKTIIIIILLFGLVFLASCSPTTSAETPTSTREVSSEPMVAQPTASIVPEPTLEINAETPNKDQSSIKFICQTGESFETCSGGPQVVIGEASSGNFVISPETFPNPTVALIDYTNVLKGLPEFVSDAGQIFGFFTEPLFPGPGKVRINLPIAPSGNSVDLDSDGIDEAGLQVFALQVASNMISDPYLQQVEQISGMSSVINDVSTGAVLQASYLVYAPDANQAFPAGFGEDGRWFTEDDPVINLPAGYTVATLSPDGIVTLDRSPEVTINTLERTEAKSLDFSKQGILESYNSLIDTLKKRYAYTELRNLDWEAIRNQYLPQVEQAQANQDYSAYYLILKNLALSIKDGHVAATTFNVEANSKEILSYNEKTSGGLGASTFAVIDEAIPPEKIGDRILVLTVGEGTPAAAAGWVPGTEIISINGEPASAWLDKVPLIKSIGTDISRKTTQARFILNFPEGETVTIGYRLPDNSEVLTATMVAGDYQDGLNKPPDPKTTPITYEEIGEYAALRWSSFMDNLLPKIAVLEEALAIEKGRSSGGVILDLRSNTGGLSTLYETMASYFFTEDNPMQLNVFDWYRYDEKSGGHIRTYSPDYQLSSPRPELAYTGPVVILIDEFCVSACEYFTQHLQVLKRATVVAQYPSGGAGGFIDRIKMPGDISFQFTQGGTYFTGTNEPNLEAKGAVPDIQVPVTLETEQAKLKGVDPVMQAALAFLDETANAAQLTGITWQWKMIIDATGSQTPIEDQTLYTIIFADDGTIAITADCNQANGSYTTDEGDQMTITLNTTTTAVCPEGSRSEDFLKYLGSAIAYTFQGEQLGIVMTTRDGSNRLLLFSPQK